MRILMPSIVDPRLSRGGAWTATRGLMRLLELAWPGAEVDCIPLRARALPAHRARQAWCMLRAAAGGGLPAKIEFARDRRLLRAFEQRLGGNAPDLVIVNGSDLLWLLPHVPAGVPVLLAVHNIEHELLRSKIALVMERWPILARSLERDWRSLRDFEWKSMRRVDGAIFLSELDRAASLVACPELRSLVLPPVFGYEPHPRAAFHGDVLRIGMFADFTWWPNIASLRWFLEEIWPAISAPVVLHLFGFGSERAGAGARGVHSHGYVDDPRDPFSQCDLMIAPIVMGAGVKVKVAESLYNRVPVVATPFALRGLALGSLDSVHQCESAEDWGAFLNSESARRFAREEVPAEVASRFSPDRFAGALRGFLSDIRAPDATITRAG